MLTGELPLGRFGAPSEKSAVDARVDQVVLRALEKEREYRQKSAAEVKKQVETIAATAGPSSAGSAAVPPVSKTKPDRFWRWFVPTIFTLFAIPVGLAILYLVVGLPRSMNARRQALIAEEQARHAHAEAQASAAASAVQGKFVIGPSQVTFSTNVPGELHWAFDFFVPANHIASVLFVRWDKGVPTIDPGFSAYFKVGPAGGVDIPFCTITFYPIAQSQLAVMTNAEARQALAQWGLPGSVANEQTSVVQWNVNLGLGFTSSKWLATPAYRRVETVLPRGVRSGYQRAIRLVDFQTPDSSQSYTVQPGVELRILVEPLHSAPIKTVPHEIERTNYIAGSGLAGSIEQALHSMKTLPIEP